MGLVIDYEHDAIECLQSSDDLNESSASADPANKTSRTWPSSAKKSTRS